MKRRSPFGLLPSGTLAGLLLVITAPTAFGQAESSAVGLALYKALVKFDLSGGIAQAENAVLKRDRSEITFNGTFYFELPLEGHIRGAVFIGDGKVRADAPNSITEKENLRRLLHADIVESTFKTAVLRFSDDTPEALGLKVAPGGTAPDSAQRLASDFSQRILRETGANISARILVSVLNHESPGVFMAEFDKGSRGRFDLILDDQGRVQTADFGLNGGEKGLFFAYDESIYSPDIWMAFYSLSDYESGRVEYSDAHALVKIGRYDMEVDVRDWKRMKLEAHMHMTALGDGIRAIPLMINEALSARDNDRLKKALRLKGARLTNGARFNAIQEEWDGNVTLLLPMPLDKGQVFEPILDFEGEYLFGDAAGLVDAHYVRSDAWYPRHVDLERSQFDITFRHKHGTRVASIGQKVREEQTPDKDMLTEWRMDQPVPLATFAVGDFQVFSDKAKMEQGGELDLDFYRIPGSLVKTDFVLTEMNNCVRYFSVLFGPYPYPRFGATYHPFPFGQGFPTMLMLPKSDRADKYTYSFIAHETSHQWWGNIVAWRSYRDQWLSEGFADYSGVLYTALRDTDRNSPRDLLRNMQDSLIRPPENLTGLGKGRLADIGPIILGHRLNTRESYGAYTALIYKKGALVLRMLHFLFTDPSTGDDKLFFGMMKDFVGHFAGGAASTEDFMAVANEHFVNTPIARTYGLKDLGWFFRQWVYEASLPSYQFTYSVEAQRDGSAMIHAVLAQRNAPNEWVMPLPLVVHLGSDKVSRGIVIAVGQEKTYTIHVSSIPASIELDPDHWILSEKTTTAKTSGQK